MNSIATRTVCAVLSVMGAAGLVAFVDPANAVAAAARHAPAATVIVATTPAAIAHRG